MLKNEKTQKKQAVIQKLLSVFIFTVFFSVCTDGIFTANAAVAKQLPSEYITGLVGDRVECDIHLPLEASGSCTFQITGNLPEGLKAHKRKGENQTYVIEGKIKETLDGAQIQVKAKDKKGKEYLIPVYFYIGSKDKLVTWVQKDYNTILAGDKEEESIDIQAVGGSGEYQLNFLTSVDKMISDSVILNKGKEEGEYYFDEDGRFVMPISDHITAGTYSVSYKVTDKKDKQKNTEGSFNIQAEKAVKLTGKTLTADGKPLISNELKFFMKENTGKDGISNFLRYDKKEFQAYQYNQKDGSFTAYVAPSQKYKVVCSGNSYVNKIWHTYEKEQTIKNLKVGKKDQVCKLKFPCYKITLKGNYNFKEVKYVKKGKYNWNRAAFDNPGEKYSYHYKLSFKANKSRTIKVKVTKQKRIVLKIGKKKKAICNQYMKFKTAKAGVYTFTSSKIKGKVTANLFYKDKDDGMQYSSSIAANNGKGNKTFKLKERLGAGRTFYLQVTGDETEQFNIKVTYSKK